PFGFASGPLAFARGRSIPHDDNKGRSIPHDDREMSIFLDKNTKVIVQGITGSEGSYHTSRMLEYGTNILGGVTPGKGGQKSEHGLPVFDTVRDAVDATGATHTCIFVPPPFAADA